MKLVIDIPEEIYNNYKEYVILNKDAGFPSLGHLYELIGEGKPIPDNATNGQVIRALFPNIESRLDEKTGIMLVKWVDGTTKTFKAYWWNSPYNKEGEKMNKNTCDCCGAPLPKIFDDETGKWLTYTFRCEYCGAFAFEMLEARQKENKK